MRKEEKQEIVEALVDQIKTSGNCYITDTADLTAVKVSDIHRKCFGCAISMQVAMNTLNRKSMELAAVEAREFEVVLKGSSALLLSTIDNAPAKLIKDLRKTGPKPVLKGAYIDSSVFIGDDKIDLLASLKSKEELVGEIIGLLQSPAKNVVSALQSGGNKLAGIVKTLQEREG